MYRFLLRPKWIAFHLVVLSAIIGMLFLARWQWNRHLERDAFVATVEARQDAEPVDLAPLLDTSAPDDIEYRRVTGTGRYLDDQLVEILQTRGAVNGVNVISFFAIDDGPTVVVNRGFVADGQPIPDPPEGTLRIGGLARTSEVRRTGQLTDNDDGAPQDEIRRIDLDVVEQRSGIDVAPVYLDFIASEPAAVPPPEPVAAPDLSGGPPHVSYTVQWTIFSIAVGVGWVFAVRRSLRTRRRAAAKAAEPAATEPTTAEPVSAASPAPPSA